MDDDGIDRGLLQQHDVAREFARQLFRPHGVTAVFHDDGLRRQQRCMVGSASARMRACWKGVTSIGNSS